jgi:hypothetical protein
VANDQQHHRSHLFTLRLWAEESGPGQTEWRGKLQHVLSREAYYFRDWSTLIDLLLEMLLASEAEQRVTNSDQGEPGRAGANTHT